MNITEELKHRILILDGAMGTEIFEKTGTDYEFPEKLNIRKPEVITRIHKAYVDSGADIIETNTLGANRIKLAEYGMEKECKNINLSAVEWAKKAVNNHNVFIAGSIGAMGKLIKPLGEISFNQAYDVFAEQAKFLEQGGADLLLIETQIDILEAKTAYLAAKESTSLPIAVSLTYPLENNLTVTGTDPETAAITLSATDADIIGINCGRHPRYFEKAIQKYRTHTEKPVIAYANAGAPEKKNNRTVFPLSPSGYLEYAVQYYNAGAHIIGGCCGTTPEHIKLISNRLKGKIPKKNKALSPFFRSSSRNASVFIGEPHSFKIVGENINPFSRKELDKEFKAEKLHSARDYARRQEKAGAHALDLNLGKTGDKKPDFFSLAVMEIQLASKLPVFLDNNNPLSIEKSLQNYAGKAVINSINGEKKNYERLLPMAKKYGAGVILLAMDENGIPEKTEKRIIVIENLVEKAYEYGLSQNDILIDPIVLSLSSSQENSIVTLDTIEKIKKLKLSSILGLSNVSYGLPHRRLLNRVFLSMAIERGLDSAILNPFDKDLLETVKACDSLTGKDAGLHQYIQVFGDQKESQETEEEKPEFDSTQEALFNAILEGEKNDAGRLTRQLIEEGENPLDILKKTLSPALELVGEYYENKKYFLPQLILSAEAMESAAQIIENTFPSQSKAKKTAKIVLATVKGDLHDIGKNIVALVLRNSGYEIIDLGKNVDSDKIIQTAIEEKSDFIGLSALMTTSLDNIERVIQKKNKRSPGIKVIIGGAAVSSAFAKECGADSYAKDAMDALKKLKKMV
jgi:5-methyltetrahydrofolate--homocysteine methyltransferase